MRLAEMTINQINKEMEKERKKTGEFGWISDNKRWNSLLNEKGRRAGINR